MFIISLVMIDILIFLSIFSGYVTSRELDDEFLMDLDRIVRYCWRELDASNEDIHVRLLRLVQGNIHRDAECFVACVFKNGGLMDHSGMVVVRSIYKFASNIWSYLPAARAFERIRRFALNCAMKANDAQFHISSEEYVDVACHRATLMFKCMAKIEPKHSRLKQAVQVLLAASLV